MKTNRRTFEPIQFVMRWVFAAGAVLLLACDSEPSSSTNPRLSAPLAARATSDVVVSAAAPDSASQDTTLDVTISGSGFASGSVAQWALAGVTDPAQVRTNSTRYVNARTLVANITISKTATTAKWDVMVTSGTKGGIGSELFVVKLSNTTGTWKLPLADASLSLKSDRQYNDGTYSVYAAGVCNVSGLVFTGEGGSTNNSGDATIQTSNPTKGKCGRLFTISYPDGVTETLASFANLNQLESTDFAIPIGTTAARRLVINPGALSFRTRCGRVIFGVGPLGEVGIGSDSVLVTRIDASTWQVQSKAAPNNLALCESTNQLYQMRVSFLVVSSRPLR